MKEVFVFGAGASYASADIPLGERLGWEYYFTCFDMHEISVNGTPVLDKETVEFNNFRHFLELCETIFPELKGIAERWERDRRENISNTPWPSYANKKYFVDHIAEILFKKSDPAGVELIRQIVLEHIATVTINNEEYQTKNLYCQFMTHQLKRPYVDFSIIDFNFDTLLMLENKGNGFPLDYVIKFDKKTPFSSLSEKKIPVFKLHGSLDWAFCPVCKRIEWLRPFVKKQTYENSFCKINPNCSGKLKPLIFLPYESMNDDLIALLRQEATKKLQEADKITIIGYSFPGYDLEERDLFRNNIKSSILLELVDVLPKEEILRKYKNIFPGVDNVKVFSNGFEGYIKNNCG